MAAQATVAAIRSGCEMLSQGKAEIQNAKATVEKTVKEAKAIYAELAGLWEWAKNLFGFGVQSGSSRVVGKQTKSVGTAVVETPKSSRAINYKPKRAGKC